MINAVFFDLDGTVYYGDKLIDGANDIINLFRERGMRVFFLTNNSTKTRKQIFDKLVGIGVDCRFEEVITSGYIAALYAQKEHMKKVYVFGTDNLKQELIDNNVSVCSDESANNLLIGYDAEFTYEDLTKAMRVAFNANHIIACNKERYYPGKNAELFPGCGAMVAPIEWCANRDIDYVVGKPNTLMIETVCEKNNIDVENVLMIGDTYESDILMAKKVGCKSIYIGEDIYHDTICVKKIADIANLDI